VLGRIAENFPEDFKPSRQTPVLPIALATGGVLTIGSGVWALGSWLIG
jgi:hypothetical protein